MQTAYFYIQRTARGANLAPSENNVRKSRLRLRLDFGKSTGQSIFSRRGEAHGRANLEMVVFSSHRTQTLVVSFYEPLKAAMGMNATGHRLEFIQPLYFYRNTEERENNEHAIRPRNGLLIKTIIRSRKQRLAVFVINKLREALITKALTTRGGREL
ncbi:hypothetical protein EVAR_48799_1 [Eumeta japonica]|uniref:Uncharacterized protein n=1 Tax=Eumeta variegata TaxID=151549 RepID=A0A4C1Y3M9_EUMVA|nr:hypothetical protein EVAR_48799_1 [Eumeta japonica]